MKILVTGGCGFIGSHLVDKLVESNYEVVVVDNLSANNETFYYNDGAEYHKVDVCDRAEILRLSKRCSFVFHLAAESRLQQATINPQRAVEVNIGGTLSVLEACRSNRCGLVFSSTSSVYGIPQKFPIDESITENCLNPYASTKYAAELLIRNYYHLHGVESTILRYFNVFGERAPSRGQYALVTGIFLQQKKNEQSLTVVGDGQQRRDFVYVKDVADANIACINNWNRVNAGTAFNIGSGKDVSVLQLAESISNDIKFIEARKGEAVNNLCTYEKFNKCTGWNPKVDILSWIETQ